MMAKELPEYFKCPISLQIMSDPIILSSGHTFDHTSIIRWISAGNSTCPITNIPLSNPPLLIPNHILRTLISRYTPPPNSVPNQPSSEPGSVGQHGLCARIMESGAGSAATQKAGSALGTAVAALRSRSAALAATVLTNLAVTEENKAVIGAHPGAIWSLVSLLNTGNRKERKVALTTLFTICSFPENRRRAVDCGAVPVLLKLARSGHERAMKVVGLLARCRVGREELVECDGVVETLLRYVMNGSSRGVQYALFVLSLICPFSERVKNQVKSKGVLEICLGLIHDENLKIRILGSHLAKVLQQD